MNGEEEADANHTRPGKGLLTPLTLNAGTPLSKFARVTRQQEMGRTAYRLVGRPLSRGHAKTLPTAALQSRALQARSTSRPSLCKNCAGRSSRRSMRGTGLNNSPYGKRYVRFSFDGEKIRKHTFP